METKTMSGSATQHQVGVDMTRNAQAVLAARYLKKDDDGNVIETPQELFERVAAAVAEAETQYGMSENAVETIREAFYGIMARGQFMPNSPTLMNAGRSMGMLSACFVLPVDDSIDGIFESIKNTALIQKAGGGTGFSFSRLRPCGDRVSSSGGTTSGPLSFMRVFSEATNAIQQGAFRRGANMGIIRIDHPNVVEFIDVKRDRAIMTNFNLSVAVTDEFMERLSECPGEDHIVRNPRDGEESVLTKEDGSNWKVGELFDVIVNRAWESGEPGVVFIDEINRHNPTPHVGEIEATNPCGEQPLLPYESCNLGSINLLKFVVEDEDGKRKFDFESLTETVHLATRFLDDVIEVNRYPIHEIEDIAKSNRKIGLGIMGFADALYALGIPYNSEEGLLLGERMMEAVNKESHVASQKLAEERGTFPNWEGSEWQKEGIKMRNACTTTVAPTGTVSILANCSCGIEPLFSLAFFRNVLDGQRLTESNAQFEMAARERGVFSAELIERIAEKGTLQHDDGVPEDMKRIFVTAHDIEPEWHIKMQSAFQKHCDSSISKTINFAHDATEAEVNKIFLMAHEEGCKGVTVYRDGCRENQPMELAGKDKEKSDGPADRNDDIVRPITMPDIMPAIKIKQMTPFGNMHVKMVVDPVNGREREVFAQLGKGGDVATSDLEAICRIVSLYLRVNGSLDDVLGQLDGIGSSLSVPTKDGRVTSLADGLARAIEKYRRAKEIAGLEALLLCKTDFEQISKGLKSMGGPVTNGGDDQSTAGGAFKVKCPECMSGLSYEEGCVVCHACGYSKC